MDTLYLAVVLAGLFIVAMLYSSVGHGGASGYLAVLSLTTYASMDSAWLKQYAWCLNLVVAGIAFWHYYRAGYHVTRLTIPFIAASIPFAVLGGSFRVDGGMYDTLLSLTLLWAAWRLVTINSEEGIHDIEIPELRKVLPAGGAIGLMSGVVGVGGGIFLSPILLLRKWATPKAAAATAAIFVWVNSAAGLAGAGISGQLELEIETLTRFAAVVVLGGFVGSRYGADHAHQRMVRNLLVIVLLLAAGKGGFQYLVSYI